MPRSPSTSSALDARSALRAAPSTGERTRGREPSRASRLLHEARWMAFAALALYLFLILVTYHANDPGWSHDAVVSSLGNRGGRFGAWLADVLLSVFGHSAYWLIVLLASRVAVGYRALMRSRLLPDDDAPVEPVWTHVAGFVVMLVASCGIETMRSAGAMHGLPQGAGGVLGGEEVRLLVHAFGMTGATLAMLLVFAVGFSLFTGWSWLAIAEGVGGAIEGTVMLFRRRREVREDRAVGAEAAVHREEAVVQERVRIDEAPPIRIEPQVVAVPQSTRVSKEKQVPLFAEMPETALPPLSLLAPPPVLQETVGPETMEFTSRLIEKKLKDFGVDVQVVAAHPGPIITRYEIEPATGVKGSQILGLA